MVTAKADPSLPAPEPPPDPPAKPGTPVFRRPLPDKPLVRGGVYAWSLIGIAIVAVAAAQVVGRLAVVTIPLTLALFPAAVLAPPVARLRRMGLPPSLATLVTVLAFVGVMVGIFSLLAPSVAEELGDLGDQLAAGYEQAENFLQGGPFGLQPVQLDQLIQRFRDSLTAEGSELGGRALEAFVVVAEGFAGLALGLFALFFYLKDGAKMSGWIRGVFPARLRDDVEAIGERVWFTIGAYIRGQLAIALVDATLIGIGLTVLRVPLVLPLSVLVFIGGLFPIIGAITAGAVAVLVALATKGPALALLVLLLIIAVQQVEGHVLAPLVLGKATALHPLAVIASLAAGGVLLGVLGAFLSVPVAASVSRAVGYLRARTPG